MRSTAMNPPQRAYVEIATPRLTARAGVSISPAGLLAIGTMVSMILAGSAAIVVAARGPGSGSDSGPESGDVSARGRSRRSRR